MGYGERGSRISPASFILSLTPFHYLLGSDMGQNSAGDDLGVIPRVKRMHETIGQFYINGNTSPITEQSRRLQRTRRLATVASFSLFGFLGYCLYWISLNLEHKAKQPNLHAFQDYSENKYATSLNVPPLHLGNDFNWTNVSTY